MKKYEKPNFEVKTFDVSDIITVSSPLDASLKNGAIQETINFEELNI